MDAINKLLQPYTGKTSTVADDVTGFVALVLVPMLDRGTFAALQDLSGVALVYYYEDYYLKNPPTNDGMPDAPDTSNSCESPEGDSQNVDAVVGGPRVAMESKEERETDLHQDAPNRTLANTPSHTSELARRAPTSVLDASDWALSQLSTIPGKTWKQRASGSVGFDADGSPRYKFNYDNDPAGAGQTVYLVAENVVWLWHPEFHDALAAGRIHQLRNRVYITDDRRPDLDSRHGSSVAARINGARLGVCKMCTVVWVGWAPNDYPRMTADGLIEQLQTVITDVRRNKL
ncbi:hypothetical protein HMPREF1624_02968 [Sporothrix schenckii ATCC 58251]|uniref:Uncharacterized protein n=1 Tax=Sporothrix schenckii (strain ATCC 58251 / de Perez 2211183) TaxID=1391915 RepID=U7PVC8_SPOS1|nr:hypothetical protein HMPREF1624_02968 [Sporothrix schenckii ATCC 58251]